MDVATHQSALPPLPVINLAGLLDAAADATIARALDGAFRTVGFCYFVNTGIDPALLEAVFAASRRFHALPPEAKRAIAMNAFHRGYMAPKTSLIETSSVARVTQPNNSESFMLMHDVPPDDPRFGTPLNGPNQWPAGLAGFSEAVLAYDTALHGFCLRVVRPIALALDLPPGALAPYFRRPTTFLRLLHYPPQPADAPDDAFGSAPHTDYGCITILAQDNAGGLEVRPRGGDWIPAPPIPGSFVVNVADMLARWTNDRWQSTPHRVKNLSGGDRYSCPYFFDMDLDCTVACLDTCQQAPPIRHATHRFCYGDYRALERLDRHYTYRKSLAADTLPVSPHGPRLGPPALGPPARFTGSDTVRLDGRGPRHWSRTHLSLGRPFRLAPALIGGAAQPAGVGVAPRPQPHRTVRRRRPARVAARRRRGIARLRSDIAAQTVSRSGIRGAGRAATGPRSRNVTHWRSGAPRIAARTNRLTVPLPHRKQSISWAGAVTKCGTCCALPNNRWRWTRSPPGSMRPRGSLGKPRRQPSASCVCFVRCRAPIAATQRHSSQGPIGLV